MHRFCVHRYCQYDIIIGCSVTYHFCHSPKDISAGAEPCVLQIYVTGFFLSCEIQMISTDHQITMTEIIKLGNQLSMYIVQHISLRHLAGGVFGWSSGDVDARASHSLASLRCIPYRCIDVDVSPLVQHIIQAPGRGHIWPLACRCSCPRLVFKS